MFVHKVLFEFLEFKHPRLLLVSPSGTSTGGGLLGVKFLASENWCGRVHFGGHSPEWRVLAKFSVQPCLCTIIITIMTVKVSETNLRSTKRDKQNGSKFSNHGPHMQPLSNLRVLL